MQQPPGMGFGQSSAGAWGFRGHGQQDLEGFDLGKMSVGGFSLGGLEGRCMADGDDFDFFDAEEVPPAGRSWVASGAVAAGSWLAGAARQAYIGLVSRAGKRKRSEGEVPSDQIDEASPKRLAKRSRRSSYEPATPALSPLGAPFTPVRRGEKGLFFLATSSSTPAIGGFPSTWGQLQEPQQQQPPAGDGQPRVVVSSIDFWKVQVEAIYRRRNPYKLHKVTSLLEKYKGQEVVLYKKVCLTYDLDPTKFYAESAAWEKEEEKYADTEGCSEDVFAGLEAEEGTQTASASMWGPAANNHNNNNSNNNSSSSSAGASMWGPAARAGASIWGSSNCGGSSKPNGSGTLLPSFSRASLGGALIDAFKKARSSLGSLLPSQEASASAAPPHRTFSLPACNASSGGSSLSTALARERPFAPETPPARISPFAKLVVQSSFPQSGAEASTSREQEQRSQSSWNPAFPCQDDEAEEETWTVQERPDQNLRPLRATSDAPRSDPWSSTPAVGGGRQLAGAKRALPPLESVVAASSCCEFKSDPARTDPDTPTVGGRPLAGARRVLPPLQPLKSTVANSFRELRPSQASAKVDPDTPSVGGRQLAGAKRVLPPLEGVVVFPLKRRRVDHDENTEPVQTVPTPTMFPAPSWVAPGSKVEQSRPVAARARETVEGADHRQRAVPATMAGSQPTVAAKRAFAQQEAFVGTHHVG
eukprot:CAMPEP_0115064012 /NCGR_PEP_ID=MMETSP0227-20121206/9432_1 /TAXON_ID=89957 /ORGANISM="Polarella glacialis, Strain CCMP 1383" /LENGTH=701 /DNA_ID=CAMNT_0002449589 /DNA_START=113 /DNA_END=2215 /DNA_ORIENTATION=+